MVVLRVLSSTLVIWWVGFCIVVIYEVLCSALVKDWKSKIFPPADAAINITNCVAVNLGDQENDYTLVYIKKKKTKKLLRNKNITHLRQLPVDSAVMLSAVYSL